MTRWGWRIVKRWWLRVPHREIVSVNRPHLVGCVCWLQPGSRLSLFDNLKPGMTVFSELSWIVVNRACLVHKLVMGTVACGFRCCLVLLIYMCVSGLVSHASLVIWIHRFPNVTICRLRKPVRLIRMRLLRWRDSLGDLIWRWCFHALIELCSWSWLRSRLVFVATEQHERLVPSTWIYISKRWCNGTHKPRYPWTRPDDPSWRPFLMSLPDVPSWRPFLIFPSFGAFWGCFGYWLLVWSWAERVASSLVASGMLTVKVDEWCLVCYVWLAAAFATTSMLSDLFSCAARLVSPWAYCGFSVLAT